MPQLSFACSYYFASSPLAQNGITVAERTADEVLFPWPTPKPMMFYVQLVRRWQGSLAFVLGAGAREDVARPGLSPNCQGRAFETWPGCLTVCRPPA